MSCFSLNRNLNALLQQGVLYKGGLLTHIAAVIRQRSSRALFTASDRGKFIFTVLRCSLYDDKILFSQCPSLKSLVILEI